MGHYLEGHSASPRVMISATRTFYQTACSGAHGFRSHRLRSLFMLCKYCRIRVKRSSYVQIISGHVKVRVRIGEGSLRVYGWMKQREIQTAVLEVTFIDIGQGDCCLLVTLDRKRTQMLIDAGKATA